MIKPKIDPKIKLIVGLGNPGPKFLKTRHNIGFIILDKIADSFNASWQKKDNLEFCKININSDELFLVKPQTYMNSSGEIFSWVKMKGFLPEEILVVHDELELPLGEQKFKFGGSHKGHNGIRSLISFFGDKFWRFRFGISRPPENIPVDIYVLSNFDPADLVDKAINQIISLF